MTTTVTVKTTDKTAEVSIYCGDTENTILVPPHSDQAFYVHSESELIVTECEAPTKEADDEDGDKAEAETQA